MSSTPKSTTLGKRSRLSAVLELAELLNVEKCQKSEENTQLLRDILSTVKDIHEVLKQGFSSNDSNTQKSKPPDVEVSEEIECKPEPSEIEIEMYEEEKVDESAMEYTNVEYVEPDDLIVEVDQTKPFPMKTVADIEWLDKEIAKITSPYRVKIIESMHRTDTHDYKISIRNFLKVVFDDTLLRQYNVTGSNGKRPLNDLKNLMMFLRKLLFKWYPGTQMTDITTAIRNYIKTVGARLRKTNEEQLVEFSIETHK